MANLHFILTRFLEDNKLSVIKGKVFAGLRNLLEMLVNNDMNSAHSLI